MILEMGSFHQELCRRIVFLRTGRFAVAGFVGGAQVRGRNLCPVPRAQRTANEWMPIHRVGRRKSLRASELVGKKTAGPRTKFTVPAAQLTRLLPRPVRLGIFLSPRASSCLLSGQWLIITREWLAWYPIQRCCKKWRGKGVYQGLETSEKDKQMFLHKAQNLTKLRILSEARTQKRYQGSMKRDPRCILPKGKTNQTILGIKATLDKLSETCRAGLKRIEEK